jgi:DNA-binding FadR family transcriptional regulator
MFSARCNAVTLPLERQSLTERAVTHMTRMITDGDWPAGMTLPSEPELAQQLGVSRTVIRECVRVLASRGMLAVQQGRGTSVVPPEAWNVTEPLALLVRADRTEMLRWLEVRTILEAESAALAAQRLTPRDAAALGQALQRIERAAQHPDAYAEADIHLHLTIARATQNPPLERLLRPVVQPLGDWLREATHLAAALAAATREHREIVAAIQEQDAPGARRAMVAHLDRVSEEIGALLDGHKTAIPADDKAGS